MKILHKISLILIVLCFSLFGKGVQAQEEENKTETLITYRYFVKNNSLQYLFVQTKIKKNRKIEVLRGVTLKLYLNEAIPENLIAKVRTNDKGEARAAIPVELKAVWDSSSTHKFLAVGDAASLGEEKTTELEITKAKIILDTINEEGTRSVTAQVLAFENGEWTPAPHVELKIGVRRLGGDLKIGDEESYTTDSLGQAVGEFQIDSLPADDAKGNIVLVAKTEENETYGDILVEKKVPWGMYFIRGDNFDNRSLWATRNKTPIWLLVMAYSIMVAVWGVIIYLIVQLIRIKRLGRETKKKSGMNTEELTIYN